MDNQINLSQHSNLFVKQVYEMAELIGFESRNKYQVMDDKGVVVAYAAEQNKGFMGWVARQFLGHWRTFEIFFFTPTRQQVMVARHPFRFFFQRLEVYNGHNEMIGALQQRWAFFRKRFDVEDRQGSIVMQVSSPWFRFWTFPFFRGGQEVGRVEKKWTGLFAEMFTDKDTFHVGFHTTLTENERRLIMAASIFIDLQYFENKGGNGSVLSLGD